MTMSDPDYVQRLTTRRRFELEMACDHLRSAGWRSHHVIATADVVAKLSAFLDPTHLGEVAAIHLRDAAVEGRIYSKRVDEASREAGWEPKVQALEQNATLRRALWVVCEELNLHNPEAMAMVELLDGVH